LPIPPGLNIPDGRRPDDEANTRCCCCCAWLVLAHPPPPWKWAFRCNRPWLPRSSSTSCAEFERSEVPRDRSLATNGCLTGLAFWAEICCGGCCCCCCSGWPHRGIPPGVPNCPVVRFTIPVAGLWTVFMPPTPGCSSDAPARLLIPPGWFAPPVGARSALRLSLSYCAFSF